MDAGIFIKTKLKPISVFQSERNSLTSQATQKKTKTGNPQNKNKQRSKRQEGTHTRTQTAETV